MAQDEIEPLSHVALARGRATGLDAYVAAQGVINREVRRLAAFFDDWAVLITSTIAARRRGGAVGTTDLTGGPWFHGP